MKKVIPASAVLLAFIVAASGALQAQCYGSLALSSSFAEFDYLVRLAVHFGDAASIPTDIICSRSMLPSELVIDVPLWAYNLHEGAGYLEFSIVSNESIAVFVPDNCWSVVGSCRCRSGTEYRLDLALQACETSCGPVRIGYAQVVRVKESDPVWIDLRPNSQTGKMIAIDGYGKSHNVFSPQHGGFTKKFAAATATATAFILILSTWSSPRPMVRSASPGRPVIFYIDCRKALPDPARRIRLIAGRI